MKIIVLGTRGIPNIQGGVETHCENLFPNLVNLGCDVQIIRRTPYISEQKRLTEYKKVRLKDIYAPHKKSLEAIVHSTLGVIYSAIKRPDILHVQAIGPSLLVPFARLLGLKVVVTNHGPDYDRKKWGKMAKFLLKLGERFGTNYAHKVIVISEVINSILKQKYKRNDCVLIYNGVKIPMLSNQIEYIESIGLQKDKYIIAVGRFVEEKGFDYLIDSFSQLNQSDFKLVLVGDSDHETHYSTMLKQKAIQNNVGLTGFIKGEKLNQIFSHARLFILPSFHEGLPISLLEAMSYNLDVLVSDIPANTEVDLDADCFFKVGDVKELKTKMEYKLQNMKVSQYDLTKYNWQSIAEQTYQVYQKVVNKI